MKVFIKICGLSDAQSVAAAVAAGADAIGFVFADSVRKVSPSEARIASREVPASVQRVAVMRHPSNDEWQAVANEFAPDVLQTDAEDFAALDVADNIVCWPVIRQDNDASVAVPSGVFVYEGANSGSGETVDWAAARPVSDRGRMILAGGLNAGNVAAAITAVRPWGVDASSGIESSPGKKDIELIRQFIAVIRAAEKS